MFSRNISSWVEVWNRKLHIYIGLYLLLFVWLFSITGLLLNHPQWKFAQFWSGREQSSFERSVQLPRKSSDLEKARALMRQLDISGEIEWTMARPSEEHFEFRVIRPGKIIDIKTDLSTARTTVEQIKVNAWGAMRMLHSFNGVRMDRSGPTRDWVLTRIWSFCMDAVSVGLIVLVLGGLYMGYRLRQKRLLGAIALALGMLSCGFFLFGLG